MPSTLFLELGELREIRQDHSSPPAQGEEGAQHRQGTACCSPTQPCLELSLTIWGLNSTGCLNTRRDCCSIAALIAPIHNAVKSRQEQWSKLGWCWLLTALCHAWHPNGGTATRGAWLAAREGGLPKWGFYYSHTSRRQPDVGRRR